MAWYRTCPLGHPLYRYRGEIWCSHGSLCYIEKNLGRLGRWRRRVDPEKDNTWIFERKMGRKWVKMYEASYEDILFNRLPDKIARINELLSKE